MAFLHLPGVSFKGLSACVPKTTMENSAFPGFSSGEADKFIASTGVERRRVSDKATCTSDLCYHAAEKLMNDLEWKKEDIDCLIFVSQTPDYLLPATSNILQARLGLNEEVFALDISSGCSGWVYGLQVMASLLSHGHYKKGLLLAGDTISKCCSPEDRSTYPLFGDAGSATAVEFEKGSAGFKFHSASDGTGYQAIIIPDGAYRNPASYDSFIVRESEPGIRRNPLHIVLDGMNVFSFGISKAPESIHKLTGHFGISLEEVDYLVLHQANLFLNEKIRKKVKFPTDKLPYSLRNFGNTSSATIPLTMVTEIGEKLTSGKYNILACGFGVGLAWGSVHFETENIVCSRLIEI